MLKNIVAMLYPKKFTFKFSFKILFIDLLFVIFNEKLIPFTPNAIIHGIIINSFGKIANKLNKAPFIPKIFIINPELNPVMNPLVRITKKIKGLPIIVTPKSHNRAIIL